MDLDEVHAEWLAALVRKTHNSTELIAHLRNHGPITPALSDLLADLLEGRETATPKPKSFNGLSKGYVRGVIKALREIVGAQAGPDAWDQIEPQLKALALSRLPETKGEITRAARLLTAQMMGMTPSQLDEFLSPRAARAKSGVHQFEIGPG